MFDASLIMNANQDDAFLIVGLGVTGQALAAFLESKGKNYLICDDGATNEFTGKFFRGFLKSTTDSLQKKHIRAVFPSPGVALTHAVIQQARQEQIPVVGELELASFFLKADFIAVTGTNGKSTTVRLISALLEGAGINNGLKGNIGAPLISAVNEPPKPFYVIEESSYQLELIGSLRHKISVCLNVTDDHFDRYSGIEDYALAKANIFKNSKAADVFIFNYDDAHCLRMSHKSSARNIPFSLVHEFKEGAFVRGDNMVVRLDSREFQFDLKNSSLKGLHNIEDMLAALTSVVLVQSDESAVESYKKTLVDFEGLPHRLQKVLEHNGVEYYDDSKGTNVGAVVMALASFPGNVILLAGGRDKEGDYAPLRGLVRGKVKKLILFGEAKNKMAQVLAGTTSIEAVENMKQAVGVAQKVATPGDVVLLSPACSSFDQYKNYAERGDDFKKCVMEICH